MTIPLVNRKQVVLAHLASDNRLNTLWASNQYVREQEKDVKFSDFYDIVGGLSDMVQILIMPWKGIL
mgnify:CR=1 FL=1